MLTQPLRYFTLCSESTQLKQIYQDTGIKARIDHFDQFQRRKNLWRMVSITFVLVCMLPLLFLASSMLPNSFEYFTASHITWFARKEVTNSYDGCFEASESEATRFLNGNSGTASLCPEIPAKASFRTMTLSVPGGIVLKFFPDVVIY